MTRTDRLQDLIERGIIDPLRVDKRPLSEIMNDEIPYETWAQDAKRLAVLGYGTRQEYLNDRYIKTAAGTIRRKQP